MMPDDKQLTITETGVAFYGGIPVGRMDKGTLILNLGWAKLAGLSVQIQADPDLEHPRNGVVFERSHG
jgi:hypothetical protein